MKDMSDVSCAECLFIVLYHLGEIQPSRSQNHKRAKQIQDLF